MRKVNTLVIGSGAAGLAAALRLKNEGVDILDKIDFSSSRKYSGVSFNEGKPVPGIAHAVVIESVK